MCHTLLALVFVITNIAVSFTTIHFPNGTDFPVQQLNSTSASYASRFGAYDSSSISFQNEGNVNRDNLVKKFIARGLLRFALQMDFALSSEDYTAQGNEDNIVFSPINIASALALVMLGSAGKTYTELSTVLGLVSGIDLSTSNDELHYNFGKIIKSISSHNTISDGTYATVASGIFVQEGCPIKKSFEKQSKEFYEGEVTNLDFMSHSMEAKDVINKWIENKTVGHITHILEYPPTPSSKVLIASALYFNGAWEYPFSDEQTAWKPFFIDGRGRNDSKEVLHVITMINGAEYPYYSDPVLGGQVVGLPYKGHSCTMYLVLPNEPGYQALKNLQYKLTVNKMQEVVDSMRKRTVIITLPRMQLNTNLHLKKALEVLGVHALFNPYQANLSQLSDQRTAESYMFTERIGNGGMSHDQSSEIPSTTNEYSEHTTMTDSNGDVNGTDETMQHSRKTMDLRSFKGSKTTNLEKEHYTGSNGPGIFVEDVLHSVTIDVTETGTEAAAATVVSITRDGSHKVVRFERPFLFFIRHELTGSILFWGTVIRPVSR